MKMMYRKAKRGAEIKKGTRKPRRKNPLNFT
jgi:hypothetical protein